MNIIKIGHCCLSIKINELHILTDPGSFTNSQNNLTDIDIVLITHEHGDHLHIDSVKEIIKNNPKVRIISNASVKDILDKEGIDAEILESKTSINVSGVRIEAIDSAHAEIFEDFGQVQNIGFVINNVFLYPGDAYIIPEKQIDLLALPVAGPWCRVTDAINYALKVKPKKAFPVHDGQLDPSRVGGNHKVPEIILGQNNIEFIPLKDGETLNL